MKNGSWLVGVLAAFGLVACGGGSGGPSAREACEQNSVISCAKLYECLTPEERAAASLPDSESACVTQLDTNNGCPAATADNICEGPNETYHSGEVDACADQLNGLDCATVRNGSAAIDAQTPACGRICSVE